MGNKLYLNILTSIRVGYKKNKENLVYFFTLLVIFLLCAVIAERTLKIARYSNQVERYKNESEVSNESRVKLYEIINSGKMPSYLDNYTGEDNGR
jgi:hypothetical protein